MNRFKHCITLTHIRTAGCTDTAHKNTFKIDEEGMRAAITAWIAYLMR